MRYVYINAESYQTYSFTDNKGKDHTWKVNDIWKLVKSLKQKPIDIKVSRFKLDEDIWFNGYDVPSPNNILSHMRRILSADTSYPILLDKDFYSKGKIKIGIIDGAHRIIKQKLFKKPSIKAYIIDLSNIPKFKK